MSQPLSILIADDNETDRMILRTIVRKEGHQVLMAADGKEAISVFKENRPDLILLDVIMPELDGFEVARQVRVILKDDYVPIVFLTSLQDAESLARCLESGGDDFLSKPYNRIILKAKIKAFGRMRMMHLKLQEHNRQMLIEQQVAKTIFDNVAHSGCLDLANISHSLSPLSVFNGDTVLAERKPDGGIHLFLGDFTGHGLPAAIGAMPLAEIFYGMTAKGFSMGEVLREINSRLKGILPVGVFCCGCFVELDFYEKKAKVWMGGLPDIVCYRAADATLETLSSTSLPLGVLGVHDFQPAIKELAMEDGDELFVWSDGIIEARDASGELFGEERLLAIFDQQHAAPIFDTILKTVDDYVGEAAADDDITLLAVKMVSIESIGLPNFEHKPGVALGPQDWTVNYELKDASLRHFNPVPLILNMLTEVDGLRPMSGQLYTLLAELYSNALEHGVLGLSSSLKSSSDGFKRYYVEREKRLAELTHGHIIIRARHLSKDPGGELKLSIEDSGDGFNHKKFFQHNMDVQKYSGRGLPLISGICDEFAYNDKGNVVHARLTWP